MLIVEVLYKNGKLEHKKFQTKSEAVKYASGIERSDVYYKRMLDTATKIEKDL